MVAASPLLFQRRAPSTKKEERLHSVGERALPLAIHRNPRARRLILRIVPGGRSLRVTAPPQVSQREIDAFLARNAGWLAERLDRHDGCTLSNGGELSFRGKTYRIAHSGKLRGLPQLNDDEAAEPTLVVHGPEAALRKRIGDFLRREAEAMMVPLARRHARTLGRPIKAVRFRDTRSRWGSCTADGTLSFSWRIMMAPDFVIDYLVAHEVAHLAEMNHGPRFWAQCRDLCPRVDEAKAWLKEHGGRLQAVDFSGG
ncbi:M48 family metallopeptidase [Notoacmeibacter sp. MSK16QG-6]|uniref:M48 family metallopeptidase n=1 Tax=Notoacmeibacter sp. MSK16QG-6 TaxID=2957982 RepID=UPI00209D5E0A|nr:SprT family zinc-dependent metalloprotease [Notoacmeibacter sp. MSK16QG-6]MCP1198988.1 M48 family metallopeptidase [Notoacmeibacter sp. MSK16QG-6]